MKNYHQLIDENTKQLKSVSPVLDECNKVANETEDTSIAIDRAKLLVQQDKPIQSVLAGLEDADVENQEEQKTTNRMNRRRIVYSCVLFVVILVLFVGLGMTTYGSLSRMLKRQDY